MAGMHAVATAVSMAFSYFVVLLGYCRRVSFDKFLFSLTYSSRYWQMGTRSAIRRRYRIEGGSCGDCCASFCCEPCELTQASRELEREEKSMGTVAQHMSDGSDEWPCAAIEFAASIDV